MILLSMLAVSGIGVRIYALHRPIPGATVHITLVAERGCPGVGSASAFGERWETTAFFSSTSDTRLSGTLTVKQLKHASYNWDEGEFLGDDGGKHLDLIGGHMFYASCPINGAS